MLYRLTEHIIIQVVAEVMVLFAVSPLCASADRGKEEKGSFSPLVL